MSRSKELKYLVYTRRSDKSIGKNRRKERKMYKIIYTKRAKVELENLYNYIYFNLANPIAAKRFKTNIIKPISNLESFPYMGN
ncbi:MAG: type II toxin-antitoxin system RelE/ParE family toxin [Clostridia bacterium]